MKTRILKTNSNSLKLAKKIIDGGGVVAFPTETVYGLGANAFDGEAVSKIFQIKGRPNDNPLIVHVHKDYDISRLVKDVPDYAKSLAKAFLPGPLTMVYKSKNTVSKVVSCGLDTLAVRIPAHKDAQKLLKYLDLPVAAPSANKSKHVSPTSADHVFNDLEGEIELILDGGKSQGGIESTVLDCTGEIPVVLRSGLISKEMIASVAGDCGEYVYKYGMKALSPGMKYKHYSPACRTVLYDFNSLSDAVARYNEESRKGIKVYLLCDGKSARAAQVKNVLNLGETEQDMAANLYALLREGEKTADLIIAVAPEKQDGVMAGVINRLTKACR